jgi:hypothetical protein
MEYQKKRFTKYDLSFLSDSFLSEKLLHAGGALCHGKKNQGQSFSLPPRPAKI